MTQEQANSTQGSPMQIPSATWLGVVVDFRNRISPSRKQQCSKHSGKWKFCAQLGTSVFLRERRSPRWSGEASNRQTSPQLGERKDPTSEAGQQRCIYHREGCVRVKDGFLTIKAREVKSKPAISLTQGPQFITSFKLWKKETGSGWRSEDSAGSKTEALGQVISHQSIFRQALHHFHANLVLVQILF